ncbi:YbhN family protein [Natrinema sp. 74]|uniref:lysylphosphatidylglycerol synthase transmembrane domain-containing protein n=1 Tax=Natrinema sp. 74 TaxID=3384159 RepID=UPI0038D3C38C
MDRSLVRKIGFGFSLTLPVFGLLVWLLDVNEIHTALRSADQSVLPWVFVFVICWLLAWGLSFRVVLRSLDIPISVPWSFLLFSGATFSNNVTPFGQAGGEPITAYFISRTSDTKYETGLAAIASVDTLNFIPSFVFIVGGIGYYALVLSLSSLVKGVAIYVGGVGLVVFGGGYCVWSYRTALTDRLASRVSISLHRILSVIPRVSTPSQSTIKQRIVGFGDSIETVAANPTRLLFALGYSGVGWLCQVGALWAALYAVDATAPVVVLLFAIPLSNVAGATPLPGGAGAIDATLIALLVSATGIESTLAAAAVIIFRGFVYGVPIVIGGSVLAAITAKRVSF